MSTLFGAPQSALRWLLTRLEAGDGGKVLLAGFRGGEPQAAWAAGLRSADDYPNFVTFARFALGKLHNCNACWLMLPDQLEGRPAYHLQLYSAAEAWHGEAWLEDGQWCSRECAPRYITDNLLLPGAAVPGIMRRELQRLADRIEIDSPSVKRP